MVASAQTPAQLRVLAIARQAGATYVPPNPIPLSEGGHDTDFCMPAYWKKSVPCSDPAAFQYIFWPDIHEAAVTELRKLRAIPPVSNLDDLRSGGLTYIQGGGTVNVLGKSLPIAQEARAIVDWAQNVFKCLNLIAMSQGIQPEFLFVPPGPGGVEQLPIPTFPPGRDYCMTDKYGPAPNMTCPLGAFMPIGRSGLGASAEQKQPAFPSYQKAASDIAGYIEPLAFYGAPVTTNGEFNSSDVGSGPIPFAAVQALARLQGVSQMTGNGSEQGMKDLEKRARDMAMVCLSYTFAKRGVKRIKGWWRLRGNNGAGTLNDTGAPTAEYTVDRVLAAIDFVLSRGTFWQEVTKSVLFYVNNHIPFMVSRGTINMSAADVQAAQVAARDAQAAAMAGVYSAGASLVLPSAFQFAVPLLTKILKPIVKPMISFITLGVKSHLYCPRPLLLRNATFVDGSGKEVDCPWQDVAGKAVQTATTNSLLNSAAKKIASRKASPLLAPKVETKSQAAPAVATIGSVALGLAVAYVLSRR